MKTAKEIKYIKPKVRVTTLMTKLKGSKGSDIDMFNLLATTCTKDEGY